MSETIERRLARVEEDGQAVQETVSKLLEATRDVQRHVRRLVEQGTSHKNRLGNVDVAVGGLKEGQRAIEDQLDQVNERLDTVESKLGTIIEMLNRLQG